MAKTRKPPPGAATPAAPAGRKKLKIKTGKSAGKVVADFLKLGAKKGKRRGR
jgi:hypothetical protein